MPPQHHVTEHPPDPPPAGYWGRGRGKKGKSTFLLFVYKVWAGCKPMNTRSEQPLGASRGINAGRKGELIRFLVGPGRQISWSPGHPHAK